MARFFKHSPVVIWFPFELLSHRIWPISSKFGSKIAWNTLTNRMQCYSIQNARKNSRIHIILHRICGFFVWSDLVCKMSNLWIRPFYTTRINQHNHSRCVFYNFYYDSIEFFFLQMNKLHVSTIDDSPIYKHWIDIGCL